MSRRTNETRSPAWTLALCVSIAVLGGCSTPAISPHKGTLPHIPLPSTFDGQLPGNRSTLSAPLAPDWWTAFKDPVLDRLVTDALRASPTLKIAEARVHEAQAEWAAAKTGRKPTVDAVAEYRRQHLPPNDRNRDPLVSQYAVTGFDASWEADLSGRIRNLTAAAAADVEVRRAERDDTALAIATDLVRSYFEFRGQQVALAEGRHARELQTAELGWIRRRIDAGEANRADLAAARMTLASQEAGQADLASRHARTLHRLSVLSSTPVESLRSALHKPASLGVEPACPALSTPADLLRHRADIREAEQALVASHAIDAAAKAELLPRLTFSGQLSFFAFGWGLGPTLQWDLFDRSRVKAREAKAGAQADAAFAHYQLTVGEAVAEVEDALSDLQGARERHDNLEQVAAEAAKLTDFARRRAEMGLANRIDITTAELAEAKARADLGIQDAEVRAAWAGLYKALGGGWIAASPAATTSTSYGSSGISTTRP